ncbi:MAG: enolase C-terminal domain-like protein, partial [Nanoarchaeota archaeon]
AATSFYRGGKYYLEGVESSVNDLMEKYTEMSDAYPLISIEDPFYEEDFESFARLVKEVKSCQIVGDDLLTTNVERIQKAIVQGSCNCLLLKLNQIGTVTEALNASKLVAHNDWNVMVSHRGGESTDDFISDFSVGISSEFIKAGAPARGERVAKYNQLLRIEEHLGKKAKYGGLK